MTLPQITLDPPALKLALSIVGGLLLISMVRILFLLRTHKRLSEATEKMEKQVLAQHNQILSVKQDSNAWRGEIQRMFDAFRAEYSKRLEESEQRYQQIQQLAAKPVAASRPPPSPSAAFIIAPVKEDSVAPLPALTIS
jgi:CHASE3 domain sensor protein